MVVSKLIDFCVGDRMWLRGVGIEIELFFVRGVEIDRVRVEIELFSVWWSMDLVFVWLVEIDLILDASRKSLDFSASIEIHSAFMRVVKIDLVSVWVVYPL